MNEAKQSDTGVDCGRIFNRGAKITAESHSGNPAPSDNAERGNSEHNGPSPISAVQAIVLSLIAIVSFHVAYALPACSFMIAVYLFCLSQLAGLSSGRRAFYVGLAIGVLIFAPQLGFFWNIFGPAALALWLVLAFWIALFVSLSQRVRARFGMISLALLGPFLWTGLEYFRSELYYLRFSWLNVGFAFSSSIGWLPIRHLGVYGIGFAIMLCVGLLNLLARRHRVWVGLGLLGSLAALTVLPSTSRHESASNATKANVAGIQLEFPTETEVISSLNQLARNNPVQLIVLSEYAFDRPVPDGIRAWCLKHSRYLIVGAKAPASSGDYYDTAFVIGPDGTTVFQQGKCVPIQFFKDGLPAREQRLWDSPWGKIGICICYDLSYSRVTDELVRMGAQALVVPTMDITDWGKRQHELHARVAPVRAAEYGIPIFRLASSGISQCVDARGNVLASAPFPGSGATIVGLLDLADEGSLPLDRLIAPLSVLVTGILLVTFTAASLKTQFTRKHPLLTS